MIKSLEEVHGFSNFRVCFIALSLSNESKYKKILEEKKYDVWHLVIQHSSFTGGLFNYGLDNQNYIDIIKSYHISDTRVTKEEIDSFSI
jgi:hypothetical protein